MRCNLHAQLFEIDQLIRFLVNDAEGVELLLLATLQQTKGTRTVRNIDDKAYRIQRYQFYVLMRFGRARRFGRIEAPRAPLAQLYGIREQVKQQNVATPTQRIGQLVDLTLGDETAIGADQVCRAAIDVVEYVKDGHARLRAPLVLVDVQRHLLDGLQCLLETRMIRITAGRVLQYIIQQQTDAGQPLHGPDHKILQALPPTLRLRLINLEEGVEAWIFAITVLQLFLHLLVEIHIRWVGLDQVIAMLYNDVPDEAILAPIGMQPAQMLQHALMHLVNGQKVAKD